MPPPPATAASLQAGPAEGDAAVLLLSGRLDAYSVSSLWNEALAALISWVKEHHPACQFLALTVHPENHAAQRLYTRMAFTSTGDERDGEPVYRLALRESSE
jgi:hypothetical protein